MIAERGYGVEWSGCWLEIVRVVPLPHLLCQATSTAWLWLGRGRPRIEIMVEPTKVRRAARVCVVPFESVLKLVETDWLEIVGVVVVLVRGYTLVE